MAAAAPLPTIADFEREFALDASDSSNILGKGGFSCVYKCTRRIDNEELAVKVAAFKKDSELQTLMREAKLCSVLQHANIVQFLGIFHGPNVVHLVFEKVTGGELFDAIVKKSHFSEVEASACLRDILSAVKACHDKNIIHRDLKPENLLLTDRGTFKLTDFGLAIRSGETKFHGFCGTPAYMAPEMVKRQAYSYPVDVWACGTILYILLVGYQPFWSDDRNELYRQITEGDYTFPAEDWGDVSEEAQSLVRQMLHMDGKTRLTVDQCLDFGWVKDPQGKARTIHRAHTIQSLKKFNARRKIKSGFQAVRASVSMLDRARKMLPSMQSTLKNPSDEAHLNASDPSALRDVLATNKRLIDAILARDWQTYRDLCSLDLTCFEPEAPGVLIEGLTFHKFYFDMPKVKPVHPPQTTILNMKANFVTPDVAILTYVRLTQAVASTGVPFTSKSEETRVWKRRGNSWVCMHFHRSGAPSAPSK